MKNENENVVAYDASELTTADGRKIVSFSAGGESYAIESTEAAARGRSAEVRAELDEIKLKAAKRGIKIQKMR